MKNKILASFLTVVFLIIFLLFYKGLRNSNIYIPKANIEKNIPSFKAQIFDSDNQINYEDIFENDKFYLINIWASWCLPCKDEHPFLMSLSKKKNLEIIGLNYKDNIKQAKKFLKKLNNPYVIILSDKDGTKAIELGAYGVPETFLVYNKKMIKKITGPINDKIFLEIEKIIK